ncbi:MAG: hypothetical protein AAF512_00690 [Pseudomonadota bacterium]
MEVDAAYSFLRDSSAEFLLGLIIGFVAAVVLQKMGWWGDRALVSRVSASEAKNEQLELAITALREELAEAKEKIAKYEGYFMQFQKMKDITPDA